MKRQKNDTADAEAICEAADAAFSLQRAIMLDKEPASIIGQFGFAKDNVAERIRSKCPSDDILNKRNRL